MFDVTCFLSCLAAHEYRDVVLAVIKFSKKGLAFIFTWIRRRFWQDGQSRVPAIFNKRQLLCLF